MKSVFLKIFREGPEILHQDKFDPHLANVARRADGEIRFVPRCWNFRNSDNMTQIFVVVGASSNT